MSEVQNRKRRHTTTHPTTHIHTPLRIQPLTSTPHYASNHNHSRPQTTTHPLRTTIHSQPFTSTDYCASNRPSTHPSSYATNYSSYRRWTPHRQQHPPQRRNERWSSTKLSSWLRATGHWSRYSRSLTCAPTFSLARAMANKTALSTLHRWKGIANASSSSSTAMPTSTPSLPRTPHLSTMHHREGITNASSSSSTAMPTSTPSLPRNPHLSTPHH